MTMKILDLQQPHQSVNVAEDSHFCLNQAALPDLSTIGPQQERKIPTLSTSTATPTKRVRFQLRFNQCYPPADYTQEEMSRHLWYSPRHIQYFKARCNKDAIENTSKVNHYEQVLRRIYMASQASSAAFNQNATLRTMEDAPLGRSFLDDADYTALLKAMTRIGGSATRIGLEKTTLLQDRFETRRHLSSAMQDLQQETRECIVDYEDDNVLATQLCSLSQQMSRPARLFAHVLACAVHDTETVAPILSERPPRPPAGSPTSVMMSSSLDDYSSSHSLSGGGSSHHKRNERRLVGISRASSWRSWRTRKANDSLSSNSHHHHPSAAATAGRQAL